MHRAGELFQNLPLRPKITLNQDGTPSFEFTAAPGTTDIDQTIDHLLELPQQVAQRRKRQAVLVLGGVQGPPQHLPGATSSSEPTELTKRLLTLDEAATILRVGRTTVWEMVTAGEISAVRIRGKLLIPREEPDRYLADLIEDARASAEARRSVRRKPSTLMGRRG